MDPQLPTGRRPWWHRTNKTVSSDARRGKSPPDTSSYDLRNTGKASTSTQASEDHPVPLMQQGLFIRLHPFRIHEHEAHKRHGQAAHNDYEHGVQDHDEPRAQRDEVVDSAEGSTCIQEAGAKPRQLRPTVEEDVSYECQGDLRDPSGRFIGTWSCGRKFTKDDALYWHFMSDDGRACIAPLVRQELSKDATGYFQPTVPSQLPKALWDGFKHLSYFAKRAELEHRNLKRLDSLMGGLVRPDPSDAQLPKTRRESARRRHQRRARASGSCSVRSSCSSASHCSSRSLCSQDGFEQEHIPGARAGTRARGMPGPGLLDVELERQRGKSHSAQEYGCPTHADGPDPYFETHWEERNA